MTSEIDEGDLLLRVTGILSVTDFHPFVVRVARQLGLRGWVRHEPSGALLRAVGTEDKLVLLVRALHSEAPASTRVRGMDPEPIVAETPPVGESFVALVEEPMAHELTSEHPAPLAHVA